MISPSTPWSPKQQKSGATIKLPEKASKPICHSPCKTKLIQKPGEQTQPGSALRCTGQDGVGALIKQHQPGPRATRTSWLFPIRTKETGSWGEEGSSTNWCLKKTTNTHLQQIHSYYRLKNCLNFPPTFSSKKKTSPKAAKSLYYGLFSTSWGYCDHSFYLQFIWTKIWGGDPAFHSLARVCWPQFSLL